MTGARAAGHRYSRAATAPKPAGRQGCSLLSRPDGDAAERGAPSPTETDDCPFSHPLRAPVKTPIPKGHCLVLQEDLLRGSGTGSQKVCTPSTLLPLSRRVLAFSTPTYSSTDVTTVQATERCRQLQSENRALTEDMNVVLARVSELECKLRTRDEQLRASQANCEAAEDKAAQYERGLHERRREMYEFQVNILDRQEREHPEGIGARGPEPGSAGAIATGTAARTPGGGDTAGGSQSGTQGGWQPGADHGGGAGNVGERQGAGDGDGDWHRNFRPPAAPYAPLFGGGQGGGGRGKMSGRDVSPGNGGTGADEGAAAAAATNAAPGAGGSVGPCVGAGSEAEGGADEGEAEVEDEATAAGSTQPSAKMEEMGVWGGEEDEISERMGEAVTDTQDGDAPPPSAASPLFLRTAPTSPPCRDGARSDDDAAGDGVEGANTGGGEGEGDEGENEDEDEDDDEDDYEDAGGDTDDATVDEEMEVEDTADARFPADDAVAVAAAAATATAGPAAVEEAGAMALGEGGHPPHIRPPPAPSASGAAVAATTEDAAQSNEQERQACVPPSPYDLLLRELSNNEYLRLCLHGPIGSHPSLCVNDRELINRFFAMQRTTPAGGGLRSSTSTLHYFTLCIPRFLLYVPFDCPLGARQSPFPPLRWIYL